ncbi:WD40-repeat-containing domain protein, partial [Rhizoctonia solani]
GQGVYNPSEGHSGWVRSVALSPCGKYVITGSQDKIVCIWEASSGEGLFAPYEAHSQYVPSIAFTPDGSQLTSGSQDVTICIWNTQTGLPEGDLYTPMEHPPTELANATKDNLALNWEMDKDGWVRDSQDRLLLWIPPDLRSVLLQPHNTAPISHQGCIELDFEDARIGDVWETCYQPL